MRSITSLYGAVNIWIASFEILTKILIKIQNYYSLNSHRRVKFVVLIKILVALFFNPV